MLPGRELKVGDILDCVNRSVGTWAWAMAHMAMWASSYGHLNLLRHLQEGGGGEEKRKMEEKSKNGISWWNAFPHQCHHFSVFRDGRAQSR